MAIFSIQNQLLQVWFFLAISFGKRDAIFFYLFDRWKSSYWFDFVDWLICLIGWLVWPRRLGFHQVNPPTLTLYTVMGWWRVGQEACSRRGRGDRRELRLMSWKATARSRFRFIELDRYGYIWVFSFWCAYKEPTCPVRYRSFLIHASTKNASQSIDPSIISGPTYYLIRLLALFPPSVLAKAQLLPIDRTYVCTRLLSPLFQYPIFRAFILGICPSWVR